MVRQAPLSMGFSRQEYWSGLPFPPPRMPGANTQDPTPKKAMGRKPDGQGGSGFQGFRKAAPGTHLKDAICLSDACLNGLLPNFSDTGRRPSPISSQIRINLEL